ncbi:hypothetical protein GCM10010383_21300 [Streptomyces lomondensis]|uniref:Uncharacterized protein n=1 Tax=Streptomyces lomondensis TaxID=68229 RepID=A0ABQ2X196_9ACTN|nr:hypothetical protein GCM10010383_21300 [Streptomyces lomondensis]
MKTLHARPPFAQIRFEASAPGARTVLPAVSRVPPVPHGGPHRYDYCAPPRDGREAALGSTHSE